jgi:hypothetical protein
MSGAHPKPAQVPRPLECSRDHVLVYDALIRRPNTFRAIVLGARHVRIDALVRLGEAEVRMVRATARIVDRDARPVVHAPSLVRVGAGDGTTWRIPPWRGWEPDYAIPHGTGFLLVQAPAVWPTRWP